jgi:hypothetical protein
MGRSRKAPQGAFLLTIISEYAIIELTNINNSMNKYKQWYTNITERAKNRVLETYTEQHHVQPRSLGGSDEVDNLVNLTAREHFICHWLLVKMTTGQEHYKMLNALRMMRAEKQGQQRYNTKITARVYESIKQEYAELQSKQFTGIGNGMFGKHHTQEAKDKIRQKNLGKKLTPEQVEKLKKAITGKKKPPITDAHRAKLSAAGSGKNNANYGKTTSEETRKKIGDKIRGRKQTEEEKLVRSLANMGKKREKRLCPHCDQLVAVNGYARWHGAHCRSHPVNTA